MKLVRWIVMILTVVGLFWWLLGTATEGRTSSTFSRHADGWRGVRLALEMQGASMKLRRTPWQTFFGREEGIEPVDPVASVLVTAFPWQHPLESEEMAALNRFLRSGGTVIVGYTGRRKDLVEVNLLESLGMVGMESLRGPLPLSPSAWWEYRTERWTLVPESSVSEGLVSEGRVSEGQGPRLELEAFAYAPRAPEDARVDYRAPGEESAPSAPVIFEYRRFQGRVMVLPSALLSNGELLEAENLAWLERRMKEHQRRTWWLDEYHHGWPRTEWAEKNTANASWDLLILHLAVIYLLAVWALARRFGPPWREPTARLGSTAEFLENLGTVHHRLGHHREAARHMVDRVAELYPKTEDLPSPEGVDDGDALVRLGRDLSPYQRYSSP